MAPAWLSPLLWIIANRSSCFISAFTHTSYALQAVVGGIDASAYFDFYQIELDYFISITG